MQPDLSESTKEGLGPLVQVLSSFGYLPISFEESDFFGDFQVNFSGPGGNSITITRDRSQLMVEGGRSVLEPVGLWQAFPSAHALVEPLSAWLGSRRA